MSFIQGDQKATVGLAPPKSNWGVSLGSPPFQVYPVAYAITFTYGGTSIERSARVLTAEERETSGFFGGRVDRGGFFLLQTLQ